MDDMERKLLALRIDLLETELARLRAPKSKDGIWGSPLLLAIVGAIATAIIGLITNQTQFNANRQLERDKLESSLILRSVESSEASQRIAALQFLVKAGLISDQSKKIEALKAEDVPQIQNRLPTAQESEPLPGILIDSMNAADKEIRISAVSDLIKTFGTSSRAVGLAIELLESPKLEQLSASGRINVLVYLRNTNEIAWSSGNLERARRAIENIRARKGAGVEIGKQTDEALTLLTEFLAKIEARSSRQ